jgi:prephenate dehydrogenase
MDPKAHDKHIAYVSHLSHISAFMLGKTVINKEKHEQDLIWQVWDLKVPFLPKVHQPCGPHFKQNKVQVMRP